jgi:hypothetical protein
VNNYSNSCLTRTFLNKIMPKEITMEVVRTPDPSWPCFELTCEIKYIVKPRLPLEKPEYFQL